MTSEHFARRIANPEVFAIFSGIVESKIPLQGTYFYLRHGHRSSEEGEGMSDLRDTYPTLQLAALATS